MRWLTVFCLRLRSLAMRSRVEQELDEELRYHLDRQIEDGIARGLTPLEARYAALRAMVDFEQRKEQCRDARRVNLIENLFQDFRFAARQLASSPGFAFTAAFVLALGISAAIVIFGFVDAALIKPLPYRDPSRLFFVFESSAAYQRGPVAYRNFEDWKRLNTVFRSMAAYALNGGFTLATRNGAEQVPGTRVSADFFRTLGVNPILGRDFAPAEDSPSAPQTVIISYSAWKGRFGARQDVLGRTVTLNGVPTVIIGVLPGSFEFAPYGGADFWGTLRSTGSCEQSRACHNLFTIARLKSGVSLESASKEMRVVMRRLQREYPDANRQIDESAELVPIRDVVLGDVRPILLLLLSGAGLLLAIACVNVTTLVLARSDKRRREFAVRSAIGASSRRLFQQFAVEGIVLAAVAGGFGLLFAHWGMRALAGIVPAEKMDSMPYLRHAGIDAGTALLAGLISLIAGIVFTAVPVAHTSLALTPEDLKDGSRGSAGRMWQRLGSKLVVMEVALATVLMIAAGLLAKSLYLLLHVDLGFNPNHLAFVQSSYSPASYATDAQKIALERKMIRRISALPGVTAVALATAPPVDSGWGTSSFHVAGAPNRGEMNEALNRQISAEYFTVLGARLFRGRYFRADDASKPLVAIVNRTLVNKFFAGQNPVEKRIYYDWQPAAPMQIIGVVDDIKEGPLEGANLPALYVPFEQHPIAWPVVLVRSSQNERVLLPAITRVIKSIDPFISVFEQQTLNDRIDRSPAAYLHRSCAVLAGCFAIAALLLSVAGLYGVVAYSVAQRTREIGVRIALGAERSAVYRLIFAEAGGLISMGVAAGMVCSFGTTLLMRSLLFGVKSWDWSTLTAAAVLLAAAHFSQAIFPLIAPRL